MSVDSVVSWEGHSVRVVGTPENPLWIAADLCAALELRESNPWRHLPDNCKGKVNHLTPGGWQKVVAVNEQGLYRLIARSRVPKAEEFRQKVFGEVLPSIRKYGCYPPPPQGPLPAFDLRDPAQLLAATVQLAQMVAEQRKALAVAAPKAEAHDRLSNAQGDVSLQEAGRILGRKPNVFVATLIEDGILFRGAHHRAEPVAEYRERGYFRVRISEVDGFAFGQTLVTPRGLQWLAGRYPAEDRPGQLALPELSNGFGSRVVHVLIGGSEVAGQMLSDTVGRFVHAAQQQLSVSLARHDLTIGSLATLIDSYPEKVQQAIFALAVELHPAAAGRLN
jgi:anti-repressor protein